MTIASAISECLALCGLQVVNKRVYRKKYFRDQSARLMAPIRKEYDNFIDQYPTDEDRRKGVENQVLFIEMVHWLGLEKADKQNILDIGGRGGLFAYYCKQYGHNSYVSDIPGVLQNSPNKELLQLLQVNSMDLKIEPFVPTDTSGNRFDLVTGFRTRFHSRLPFETGKEFEEHWGVQEWEYFLDDLIQNVLSEHGRIFFMLNRLQEREKVDYVPEELKTFFQAKGGVLNQQFLYFPDVSLCA